MRSSFYNENKILLHPNDVTILFLDDVIAFWWCQPGGYCDVLTPLPPVIPLFSDDVTLLGYCDLIPPKPPGFSIFSLWCHRFWWYHLLDYCLLIPPAIFYSSSILPVPEPPILIYWFVRKIIKIKTFKLHSPLVLFVMLCKVMAFICVCG